MKVRNLQDVFTYLLSFTNLEQNSNLFNPRNYRLDRMHSLLEHFGNPHNAFLVLHVAGTKGKGSTAAFLASVLTAAGFRTGLYTSPHVSSFLERISVLEILPDEKLLVRLTNQIKQMLEQHQTLPAYDSPTTFELLTLLGFLYFRETHCRYAVLETGIGGRLDATNVVDPVLCLITPVELEHTDILGETLEEIAREKGGIIKPGVPVFSALQEPRAKEIFSNISRKRGSEIIFLDEALESLDAHCSTTHTELFLKIKGQTPRRFRLALLGDFQAENAALAYLALKTYFDFPDSDFEQGFWKTVIPGRMEVISRNPYVVLDGAHTPRSILRVLKVFQNLFGSRGVLLFGSITGKKILEMAEILAPAFGRIIITTPGGFKLSNPEETYKIFKSRNPGTRLIKSPQEALREALDLTDGIAPLLATGSFYLLGEIRDFWIKGERRS
ncbi:Folylpolyglutamate synthase [subsurface metagenome]